MAGWDDVSAPVQAGGSWNDVSAPVEIKLPDTSGIQKTAQSNLSVATDDESKPQSPSQRLDTAIGMPVAAVLAGADKDTPLPASVRKHLTDSYANGTSNDAGDFMQSALHSVLPIVHGIMHPIDRAKNIANEVSDTYVGGVKGWAASMTYPFLPKQQQQDLEMMGDVEPEGNKIATPGSPTGPELFHAFAKGEQGTLGKFMGGVWAAPSAIVAPLVNPVIEGIPESAKKLGISDEWAETLPEAVGMSMDVFGSFGMKHIGTEYHRNAKYGPEFKPGAGPWDNVLGQAAMRGIVGQATGKPPQQVTSADIDQTIANGFKSTAPTAQDFHDVSTVMGGDKVDTLHVIYKETGVRPDQVFEDARNEPSIAAAVADGKIPETYEHLIEPKEDLSPEQSEKLQVSRSDTGKAFDVVDAEGDHIHRGFDSYEEAKHYIEDKKAGSIPDEPPEWSEKPSKVMSAQKMEHGTEDVIEPQERPRSESSSDLSSRAEPKLNSATVPPGTQEPSFQISEATPPDGVFTTRPTKPSATDGGVKISVLSDIKRSYHKISDLSLIKKAAKDSKADLDKLLETISKNVKGSIFEGSRLKKEDRLTQKLASRAPQGIGDYLASRIIIDTPEMAKSIVEQLKKFANIIKIDDNMNDAGSSTGYRAIHVQIEGSNGLSAEIQIMPKEIRESYKETREFYEKWRNRNPQESPEDHKIDQEKQKSIFDNSWNKFKERVQEFSKDTKGSLDIEEIKKSYFNAISATEKWAGKLTGDLFDKLGSGYIKTFAPELIGPAAKRADSYMAKFKAAKQEAENAFYSESAKAKKIFDRMTDDQRMEWLYDHETGRWNEEENPDHARYQALLDATFKAEKTSIGADSEKGYKENYLPHMWENPDAVKAFFNSEAMIKKYGKDGFTKASTFKLIQDGIRAGFKLKTNNPESMLVARLLAGHDMMATMDLLHDMESSGIAKPTRSFSLEKRIAKAQDAISEAQEKYKIASDQINDPRQARWDFADPAVSKYMKSIEARVEKLKTRLDDLNKEKSDNKLTPEQMKELKDNGFKIIGPDSKVWSIHQEVGPLWKNAMEGKGLWENQGVAGDFYRTYTAGKAIWTSIKLGLSLFHPIHVAVIHLASGGAALAEHLINGGKFSELALKDTSLRMGMGGKDTGINPFKLQEHPAITAWKTAPESRTSEQQRIVTTMIEGGFKPTMSARDTIHFRENFDKAINGIGPNNLRLLGTAIQIPGKIMAPFFEHWIPGLKSEIYLRRAEEALKRDPSLAMDAGRRGEAFRQIAKDTDRTYGEMNSEVQFWNKTVRDSFNAAFISGGWKLAQIYNARGLLQPLNIAYKFAKTGEFNKADLTYNMLNAYAYTGLTLVTGAAINAMLGNPIGEAKDTVWDIVKNLVAPKTGELNPDGTPIRLQQPAFAKEAYMLARDINTKGLISGAGSFLYHTTLIPGIMDTLNNSDFVGRKIISDPTDLHQWTNAGWEAISPISISGYEKADAKDSDIGKYAGLAGFPLAGAYMNQTPFEQKVLYTYSEQNPPKGDAYSADLKADLKTAIADDDEDAIQDITNKMEERGMTSGQISRSGKVFDKKFVDVAWKKLSPEDQQRLIKDASDEEKERFRVRGGTKP